MKCAIVIDNIAYLSGLKLILVFIFSQKFPLRFDELLKGKYGFSYCQEKIQKFLFETLEQSALRSLSMMSFPFHLDKILVFGYCISEFFENRFRLLRLRLSYRRTYRIGVRVL